MAEIYTKKEYSYIEQKLGPKLCKLFGKLDAFLAGGAITSIFGDKPINDFDIFFRDVESFEKASRYFKILTNVNDQDTKEVCTTDRATTFSRLTYRANIMKMKEERYGHTYHIEFSDEKMLIQLVNPTFVKGTPEEVFMGFDFTICMGAYLFKEGRFEFDKSFLKDLSRRELVFNVNAQNVVSSLFRAQKYKRRGFTMSAAEEMKLAMVLGSKKFATFGDFARASGMIITEETARHLYNHIRYPDENSHAEVDSLMDKPYSVDAVIEWLEELQHSAIYEPKIANEVNSKKMIEFDSKKYEWEQQTRELLETDLSDAQVNEVMSRKPTSCFLDDDFTIK